MVDDFTTFKYSRCFSCKSVINVISVIPIIPFIGVLISWDIFARKLLFAMVARSACSFAFRRDFSTDCLSIISSSNAAFISVRSQFTLLSASWDACRSIISSSKVALSSSCWHKPLASSELRWSISISAFRRLRRLIRS